MPAEATCFAGCAQSVLLTFHTTSYDNFETVWTLDNATDLSDFDALRCCPRVPEKNLFCATHFKSFELLLETGVLDRAILDSSSKVRPFSWQCDHLFHAQRRRPNYCAR